MECRRVDCQDEAVCTIAIEFYPVKSVMAYYGTNSPLSRSVITMELCKKHGEEAKLEDLIPADQVEKIARILEIKTGTMVDRENVRCFSVPLDHPHYLFLKKKEAEENAPS